MSDPTLPSLAAGFGAAWLLMGLYLVRLWRVQRKLDARIREAERPSTATKDDSASTS